MATPVGLSTDVGETPLWDWYIIIFSILVSVIVSTGVMLLWCVNFLKDCLLSRSLCARKSTRVQQLMRQISHLDKKDQGDLLQQVMAKTYSSETSLAQEIISLKLEIETLSEKNVQLQQKIEVLRKSQGGSKPSKSSGSCFTIYVTKTGSCFHLDPHCQHLRQSAVQKMPCQICGH